MIIYIVLSRYGTEMNEPACFLDRNGAIDYIKQSVVDCMTEEDSDAADYYNEHSINATLEWGSENDLCTSYNDIKDENGNIIMDTCTIGSDWSEYMLTMLDTDTLQMKEGTI